MNENEINEQEMNFDNARMSAEEMLASQPAEEERSVNNMLADELERKQAEEQQQKAENDEAAQTALTAAQTAQQQQSQNQQLALENEQLQSQLMQMQQQMQAMTDQLQNMQKSSEQQSEVQKQVLMENSLDIPHIDFGELAFADEETAKEMQSKYAEQMRDYMRSQMMEEFSPYIEEAKEARAVRERSAVIDELSQDDMFSDIKDNEEQITRLLSENGGKFAPDLDVSEKMAMAYILTQGIKAMNTPHEEPKEPSVNELMEKYENNPEFRAAIEERRINDLKKGQQVPQMSASNGAANAALNIKDKPKNFDEAYDAVAKLFGKNER